MKGLPIAAAVLVVSFANTGPAAAQPAPVYVGAQPGGGNGDDWVQPGEVVSLKVFLYNAGSAAATAVSGSLVYLGTDPGITVTVPSATWPNLLPRGSPLPTNAPHFTLQAGAAVSCGAVLPFRLEVALAGMDAVSFDIELKMGRKLDHDMIPDTAKRFEEQEATFWGDTASANLGRETAMGDLDADGFSDLVISRGSGFVVIYGQARHFEDVDMLFPQVGMTTFSGLAPGSLATADINGDGYDDVIAGGWTSVGPDGTVAVIYGQAAPWPSTNLGSTSPIPGVARFFGADTFDGFGNEVAAGDMNGDGYDDVIASANLGDSIGNARADAGEAYLIYGRAAPWGDTDLLAPPAGVARFWGADAGDYLEQVASGDVNGDGFSDLLLGSWQSASLANQRSGAGEVYVVYGRAVAWTDTDLAFPPTDIARIWGAPFQDGSLLVGESSLTLAATGDFDGDGLDEIVLSSEWGGPAGRPGARQLYVISGRSSLLPDIDLLAPPPGIVRILGEKAGDDLGVSNLAGAASGDFNGDGYDDLVAAAWQGFANPAGPGAVYLAHGGPGRWTDVDLRDRPSTVSIFLGVDREDWMGRSVATGDVNGDGRDDLLLGAPNADSLADSRPDGGEVYLWYGKPTETYYFSLPSGSSGPYLDIAGLAGAMNLPLACDDCFTQFPIGFDFPFYANSFDTLFVSSNGFLTFSLPSAAFFLPETCMPHPAGADHLIAPFWDDLDPGAAPPGGGVFALVQGTAPYRRLTIEWKDVPHADGAGTGTFEVILFETTGQIHFRYKDLLFGNPALDNGASAVVGLENRTGAHGVVHACNNAALMGGTNLVRYVPTTPIFEERGEQTQALWISTGHWHDSTNSCEPDQHSGERGWYYGNAHTCAYSNGFAGALLAPTVADFPADARLTFWSRLGTQVGFDLPELQLSTTGTGGPYATILNVSDTGMMWKYGGVTNLFGNDGDTVDLQFHFSSDDSVSSLGWMLDDIQLVGCDAAGAPAVVQSVAYAPPQVCAGSASEADAAGSFCWDGGPPRLQWFLDGSALPGATGETQPIPGTLAPGAYEYSVEVTCGSGVTAMSEPAPVRIVTPPGPIPPTMTVELLITRTGPELRFGWEESAAADGYLVLQDTSPNGVFATVAGTAPAGETALFVPVPAGDLLYFLVAARSEACGLGPIR